MQLRVAFWIGSALSAGAFAGLIGYAVQIGSYSLARWQVMFLSGPSRSLRRADSAQRASRRSLSASVRIETPVGR